MDKQTLQILAQQCGEISELLDLVGNLCKTFLKEAEEYYDEDLDEWVVDEHGLHQWLASEGRIHGQMSLTGTCPSAGSQAATPLNQAPCRFSSYAGSKVTESQIFLSSCPQTAA